MIDHNGMEMEFEVIPEALAEQELEAEELRERMKNVLSLYSPKGERIQESSGTISERESEARRVFSIADDEDLYGGLARKWETQLMQHYEHPESVPALVAPYSVFTHLSETPYAETVDVLRESFAARNLFLGYHPVPDGSVVKIVFFVEPAGVQHPQMVCHWGDGTRFSGETTLESLHQVVKHEIVSQCSREMLRLHQAAGKSFVTPPRGRYASEDHIVFFTWAVSGRHLLFILDTENETNYLYRQDKLSNRLERIPFVDQKIQEAFDWLLRFSLK